MAQNPYEAPTARVEDRSPEHFSWWAVWVAAAAGTGTAFMIGCWMGPPFQHWFSAQAVSEAELYQTMVQSLAFGVAALLATGFGYGLGGYTAASLAPTRPILHGVVAACMCMATGAIGYLGVFPSPFPLWAQTTGFMLTVPCAVLGALYFARRKAHLQT
jgi:hypothetical protein